MNYDSMIFVDDNGIKIEVHIDYSTVECDFGEQQKWITKESCNNLRQAVGNIKGINMGALANYIPFIDIFVDNLDMLKKISLKTNDGYARDLYEIVAIEKMAQSSSIKDGSRILLIDTINTIGISILKMKGRYIVTLNYEG